MRDIGAGRQVEVVDQVEDDERPHTLVLRLLLHASQIAIGQRCLIDRSDMAEIVTQLVDRGLALRTPAPGDRRRNVITLTPAGRRRFEHLDAVLEQAQRDLFAPLTATEHEQLIRLLGRVFDHHMNPAG